MAKGEERMSLCNDCVSQGQCGNDTVVFCLSYIKNVPLKWETNAVRQRNAKDLQRAWEEHLKRQEVKNAKKYV